MPVENSVGSLILTSPPPKVRIFLEPRKRTCTRQGFVPMYGVTVRTPYRLMRRGRLTFNAIC